MSEAYDRRRAEQIAHLQNEVLAPLVARLRWNREQLSEYRTQALRDIVAHAQSRSRWHASRLEGIDPAALTEADLGTLPPMTKDDLMGNWDAIVTDPGLDLAKCEAHLARITETPEYLNDQYHVIASGGSSGKRGLFVYGWDEWATFYGSMARAVMHAYHVNKVETGSMRGASVVGRTPTHATVALGMTFGTGGPRASSFPVWLPLDEIVAGLNKVQPTMLTVYTSMVKALAAEALAGRLHIAPKWFMLTSEPLLPEIVALVEEVWHAGILNQYGTSDVGMMGSGCGLGGIHINEDLLIVEPVDASGAPVPPGAIAAKLYVTSLFQRTLPMIRYELTDEAALIEEPCPCGLPFRRLSDPLGRQDDLFRYDATTIHPHVFRSPLSRRADVVEYQVRQTARGADIDVVATGASDLAPLAAGIEAGLAEAGLEAPRINVRRVDAIGRIGVGKLKRFVPLPP